MAELEDIERTPAAALDQDMLTLCKSVEAKRARTVIDHILQHGIITNEELSDLYGYDHPPRAIRDVRENGIPLITHSVISPKTGRRMGAYTFGKSSEIKAGRIGGRKAFSRQFKQTLIEKYGAKDAITGQNLEERYLQIDHRIPYEIAGDETQSLDPDAFMLLDASSNRAKSWSCENCRNFKKFRDVDTCKLCFWSSPESYSHIAMNQTRRIDVVWEPSEVEEYDKIKADALSLGMDLSYYIKRRLSS